MSPGWIQINHTLHCPSNSVIDHSGFNPKPYNQARFQVIQPMTGTAPTARPSARMPMFYHSILHLRNLFNLYFYDYRPL